MSRHNLEVLITTTVDLPATQIKNRIDREWCGSTIRVPALVKGPRGELADVVAILQPTQPSAVPQTATPLKPGPLILQDCRPSSKVLLVRPNEPLRIESRDSFLYQLRSHSSHNARKTLVIPPNLLGASLSFSHSEIIKIQDDLHPWIHFYAVVDDRPIALSKSTGIAKFEGVPEGQYTLRLWHEIFGLKMWPTLVTLKRSTSLKVVWRPADLQPSGTEFDD